MRRVLRDASRLGLRLLGAVVGVLIVTTPAQGQLIAPGKLVAAHESLEGVTGCRNCHQLRRRGIANEKCLACHTPLRTRIEQGAGLHAGFGDRNCAECHKDHLGREPDIVRLDTATFAHDEAGYLLAGRHAEIGCRDCHAAERVVAPDVRAFKAEHTALDRTFLGLGTTCMACHREDDPHRGQFDDGSCSDCHGESTWERPDRFVHDRTRYPLTGRHRDVDCADCHRPVGGRGSSFIRFRPLAFARCQDCHTDPHTGRMGTTCTSCHGTGGWMRIDRNRFEGRFDHGTTRFALRGAHADVECRSCHARQPTRTAALAMRLVSGTRNRTYPIPVATACLSCHIDYHRGNLAQVPGGAECENCHGERTWTPTTYDFARHNRESGFTLDGAHVAVPCEACHTIQSGNADSLVFHFAGQTCETCHAADDPHQGQFPALACADCHVTEAFDTVTVNHDDTRFPLDGAHEPVACNACHVTEATAQGVSFTRYRPLPTTCRECHSQ